MKLHDLEIWFNENKDILRECQLSVCGKVIDPKLFVESHIAILKNNSGNPRYLPYYDRLLAYYNIMSKANLIQNNL